MNWLKKIGMLAAQGLALIAGFAPIVERLNPSAAGVIATVVSDLEVFQGIIQSVEAGTAALAAAGTTLSGPQKLVLALPAFEQAVLSSQFFIGKKIQDEAKFKAAIGGIASNYVDLLNALDANVSSASKT